MEVARLAVSKEVPLNEAKNRKSRSAQAADAAIPEEATDAA
jgi:hypothetical protein